MSQVILNIAMSLDGYVAGPNQTDEEPLGERGEHLHDWAFNLDVWLAAHGRGGGERTPSSAVMEERLARTGATIMGRKMFGGGPGPWGDEPWNGWWGDEPPFHHPVFVVTHHEREPLELEGTTFTFVTDGIESALEQAKTAAGDKAVALAGGGDVLNQYLAAGLVDVIELDVAPMFLGGGERLFDNLGGNLPQIESTMVVEAPGVTHLRYRVVK